MICSNFDRRNKYEIFLPFGKNWIPGIDDDVYLDKSQTRAVKKSILYM
jgi:hypothetical protein